MFPATENACRFGAMSALSGAVALYIFIFILQRCGQVQRAAGPHHVAAAGNGGGGYRRPRIATPGATSFGKTEGGGDGPVLPPPGAYLFARAVSAR